MLCYMKADRALKREANARHDATHSREFLPVVAVLAVLLALVATCAISLKFNLVAVSQQRFVLIALVCSTLALAAGTVLACAGFDALRLARRRSVSTAICDNTIAALRKHKQLKALAVRARSDAEQTLAFCEDERSKIAARRAAAACGLTHYCLSPRILSQRPIPARATRAGCPLTS
jgi:hypothetical protein